MTRAEKRPRRVWGAALLALGLLMTAAALFWAIRLAFAASGQLRHTCASRGTASQSAEMCLIAAPPTQNQSGVRLNTATEAELDTLPGIGSSLAQAILQYRQSNGAYHFPEDLYHVDGIGESKLEALRPLITLP